MFTIRLICINRFHLLSSIKFNQTITVNNYLFSKFATCVQHKHQYNQQQQYSTLLRAQDSTYDNALHGVNGVSHRYFANDNPKAVYKYRNLFRNIRQFFRIIRLKDRGKEHNYLEDKANKEIETLIYKEEYNRSTAFWMLFFGLILNSCAVYVYVKRNIIDSNKIDEFDKTTKFTLRYGVLALMASLTFSMVIARRTVLRIYYNQFERKFKLSIYRWYFPFTTKTFTCNYGEPAECEAVHHLLGNCKINNRKFHVIDDYFLFPLYCNLFYGHEKPIAFERFQHPKRQS